LTTIDNTAPKLRHTVQIFTRWSVPSFIAFRAIGGHLYVSYAPSTSPYPSSDVFRPPAPRSIRSAPKNHRLLRTHNGTFVSFQTPCTFPCPSSALLPSSLPSSRSPWAALLQSVCFSYELLHNSSQNVTESAHQPPRVEATPVPASLPLHTS